MHKLSVAIAVYNEEDNIGPCIKSVSNLADEVVIVDGSSTDQTVKIASKLGAKIIHEKNRRNFHINKQIAIEACLGPWILQLDADERVSPSLAKEISQILKSDISLRHSAYYLKRRNFFLGRWMKKGGMYPDPVIRLFQKGKARLPQKSVHELMEVSGDTGWLNEDLLHIADPSFSRYLLRSNRYTSLQADSWAKEGKWRVNFFSHIRMFVFAPLWRFLSIYIRHKGFLDGFQGFVFALYSALHITTSYIKYWERQTGSSENISSKDWN